MGCNQNLYLPEHHQHRPNGRRGHVSVPVSTCQAVPRQAPKERRKPAGSSSRGTMKINTDNRHQFSERFSGTELELLCFFFSLRAVLFFECFLGGFVSLIRLFECCLNYKGRLCVCVWEGVIMCF